MNLLITGAWQGSGAHTEKLRSLGHEIQYLPWEKDELPCDPDWVEGIIGNGIFLSHPIEQFTNLRYIQLTSAGFDRVPMEYVKEHDITIHNARGVYSIPMAEFALAGVLSLYKQMAFFQKNRQDHSWVKHRGLLDLLGKRVLIAGCGSVGTECARRFAAFGCHVIGMNTTGIGSDEFEYIVTENRFAEELRNADILVMTLPLTDQTYHMLDGKRLAMMKPTAIIVNIARGAVLEQAALEIALENNQIYGAVLDVFEEEPLDKSSILWDMEQVIVTPHNSFVGERNGERLAEVIISNLEEIEI